MKRLRSQTGESITETLVALLIASLGLIILAGAISATSRVVLKTDHVLEEYYHQNNAVAEHYYECYRHYYTLDKVGCAGCQKAAEHCVHYDYRRADHHCHHVVNTEQGVEELSACHKARCSVRHEEDDDNDCRDYAEKS